MIFVNLGSDFIEVRRRHWICFCCNFKNRQDRYPSGGTIPLVFRALNNNICQLTWTKWSQQAKCRKKKPFVNIFQSNSTIMNRRARRVHRVDRVPGFPSSRPNWLPPPPRPQVSVDLPPFGNKWRKTHSLAKEGAGSQFARRDRHSGTLGMNNPSTVWGEEWQGGPNSDEGTDTLVL
jgi:hypothetical protein